MYCVGFNPWPGDNSLSISAAGRNPKTFKFYDIFEDEFSKINSVVVDAVVDESGK